MHWAYDYLFYAVWGGFLIYWQIMSLNVKATQRLEPMSSRVLRTVLFLAAIALLVLPHIPPRWLYVSLIPSSIWTFWGGVAITLAGLSFAIWARVHLGSNWSRSVTIKKDHDLITSGPYAVARHPIYTGLLAGFLGTAIAMTEVRGVIAFGLIFAALWIKLGLEEKWMREQFGGKIRFVFQSCCSACAVRPVTEPDRFTSCKTVPPCMPPVLVMLPGPISGQVV